MLTGFRLNKLRMFLDVLHEGIRVLTHFKEIGRLRCRNHVTSVLGAFTVHKL